ncbi:MAG TPA: hypothetical protein VF212_00940 [Longimicrobiales bacterium]
MAAATATALQKLRERRAATRDAEVLFLPRVEHEAEAIHEEALKVAEEPTGSAERTARGERFAAQHLSFDRTEMLESLRDARRRRRESGDPLPKKPPVPKVIQFAKEARKEAKKARREKARKEGKPEPTGTVSRRGQEIPLHEIKAGKDYRTPNQIAHGEFTKLAQAMSRELGETYTVEPLIGAFGPDVDRYNPDQLRILPLEEARERAHARRRLHDWVYSVLPSSWVIDWSDPGLPRRPQYPLDDPTPPEAVLEPLKALYEPAEIELLVSAAIMYRAKLRTIQDRIEQRREAA